MRLKLLEWLRRYGPAELCAAVGALIGAGTIHLIFGNTIATALGGTWGENIGYYGWIFAADLRAKLKMDRNIMRVASWKVLRNMVVEFGPGEYLDSFFIRPLAMYIFLRSVESIPAAILLGKLIADIVFYVPTVLGYELRRKYFKD
ncbi:MAG: hypothetical protein HY422_00265 [Candidatus Komeilibacteria bacterium]|nr:hypothetical protein [Candidatus Komeilibacteria bacterium]